jgi:hypothetical protein
MYPLLFVAHPVTGDEAANLQKYHQVCSQLSTMGFPLITWGHLVEAHLQGWEPPNVDHDWYLRRTLPLVGRADILVAVDAGESSGVALEIKEAERLGIPVVHLTSTGGYFNRVIDTTTLGPYLRPTCTGWAGWPAEHEEGGSSLPAGSVGHPTSCPVAGLLWGRTL